MEHRLDEYLNKIDAEYDDPFEPSFDEIDGELDRESQLTAATAAGEEIPF